MATAARSGLPTYPRDDPSGRREEGDATLHVDEDAVAAYTTRALEALRRSGCLGAMLWCYCDYDPALWQSPPLDLARHERTFGLWRADGTPKPSVAAMTTFAGAPRCAAAPYDAWIDIDRGQFWSDPSGQLPRLYHRSQSLVQRTGL